MMHYTNPHLPLPLPVVVGTDRRDGVIATADNSPVYLEQGQRKASGEFFHRHQPGVRTGVVHDDVPDEP